MSPLVDATLVLLKEELACQQSEDEVLMDAVSDLLPAFAKSMGSHFAPIFAKLFDPLMILCNGLYTLRSFDDFMQWFLPASSFATTTGYISTAVNDGPGCLMLRCPGPSCVAAVGQDMIDALASLEDKEKYHRYFVRSYIEDNRKHGILNSHIGRHRRHLAVTMLLSKMTLYFVDDEDYVGKKSESTILEEVSRGKEEVDEKEVRKQEISEVELEGKLVSGVDSNSCGNVGFHKKVDCGCCPRQFDCVAKRTRSHFYTEFVKKKVKLGTASHLLSFEEEEHETTSDDGENVDVDNSYSSDATYTPKKGLTKSQKVNGMSKHVEDLCGGKPTKRKCIRTLAEHEILKILLDFVLDKVEVPFEDKNEPPSKPTLPLKFTFSNEESIPLETSEEKKELAKLWNEMASALFEMLLIIFW
ncbi:hypothetical protein K2173_009283 [Erythroxylum novogranatense]|uniref:Uncharacterized protein n=1 Tax=Erythroxylum novogranatense TaxID=1862640 RepID=A0AAV8SYS2_9ROSI|nr:hypothetical protein K2173_009283 [Erythroxylum novogranatense]